jgi:membrane-associated phospholipid phosphatase
MYTILFVAQLLASGQTAADVIGQRSPFLGTPAEKRTALGVAGLLAVAAAFDEQISGYVQRHQSRDADRVARVVEPLGRARVLLPAMAAAYGVTLLTASENDERWALRTIVGYVVTDAAGSILKLVVGRHRPDSTNDAWRFRSFGFHNEWRSLPSGHVYHAFAVASSIADESDQSAIDILSYGLATLVAAQRVYSGAHWPSDVIGGAVLGVGLSRYARRQIGPRKREETPVSLAPSLFGVRVNF